jgi:hypothetical protein
VDGLEVVAPVALHMDHLHDAPVLELLEAVAHVGAGDAERLADLLGVERLRGDEEQGMDLGDGAVDPPADAHLAPVEDEPLFDWR